MVLPVLLFEFGVTPYPPPAPPGYTYQNVYYVIASFTAAGNRESFSDSVLDFYVQRFTAYSGVPNDRIEFVLADVGQNVRIDVELLTLGENDAVTVTTRLNNGILRCIQFALIDSNGRIESSHENLRIALSLTGLAEHFRTYAQSSQTHQSTLEEIIRHIFPY